jgi:hypothetical protein
VYSRAQSLAVALGIVVAAAFISAGTALGIDYANPSWVGVNAAGESVEALARLDFATAAHQQPIMGGFSLLLRAPFVALADLLGGGMLLEYRFGSFVCVLAMGILAASLARLVEGERPWATRILVIGLVLAAPTTFKSLFWGHPEELLAAALAVGAILLAKRRPLLAAVALGSAIATKQWAVLAIAPVLVATLPERRWRVFLVAGVVAALWMAPIALGDLDRFIDQNRANAKAGEGVTPSSIWWVFGDMVNTSAGLTGGEVDVYDIPNWMTEVSQPLTMVVTFGLALVFFLRRKAYGVADALGLFALVMLLRCMLDPMTISYHHAPFYASLAAFEVVRTRRMPYLTLMTAAVLLGTGELATMPNLQNGVYLAWSLPLAGYLAVSLFAPRALIGSGARWAPSDTR